MTRTSNGVWPKRRKRKNTMMPPPAQPTAPTGGEAGSSRSAISDKPRRHSLSGAFGYAFEGFAAAWRSERNLRIHAAVAALALAGAALLRLPVWGWVLVVLAIALVVAAELLNSALEAVVDLVSPHDHPLAKRAKDVSAAAVLVAACGAAAAGVLLAGWAIFERML